MQFGAAEPEAGGDFGEHVNNLRGTMFYVCQGTCLCGTVNNRGKVIYCYGDLVPRQSELFTETSNANGRTTTRDLLAAQLGIWVFGLIALLIVLLLIRKSISSLRHHLNKVTERLPWYHDDDDLLSNHSTVTSPQLHHKDTTLESMEVDEAQEKEAQGHPGNAPNLSSDKTTTNGLKKLRLKGKDFKKGGDALRGKNVIEAYRVKDKDMKRTMK